MNPLLRSSREAHRRTAHEALALVACMFALPLAAAAKEAVRLERVTGINLLHNTGFELRRGKQPRPAAWGPQTPLPNVAFEWDGAVKRAGARSIAIHAPKTAAGQWAWWAQVVPVKPGARYRLSGYVMAKACRRAGLGVHFLDAAGKQIRIRNFGGKTDTAGKWEFVDSKFVAPPGARRAKVFCTLHSYGDAWFDDVSFAEIPSPRSASFDDARAYPCVMAKQPINVDGRLDEWGGTHKAKTGRIDTYTAAEEIVARGDRGKSMADLSATLQARYDAQRLYLAIDLRDDVFPLAAKRFWNGDCLQIAIDTGGQRGPRLDDDDYAFSFVPRGKRLAVGVDYAAKGKRPAPAAIAAAYTAKPGGAAMEIAIPWAAIGVAHPAKLATLGFSLLVNDNDGAGRKWVEWGSGIVRGKRPAEFGTLVLFPKPDAIRCAVTPADAEFDDSGYAALSLDVYALAAKRPVRARLRIENDTHAGELESPIETAAGVRSAPFMFKLAGLAPGPWRVRGEVLGADGSSLGRCDASMHVYPMLETRRRIEARAEELRKLTEQVKELVAKRRAAGFNTELIEPALALAGPLRAFALYDAAMREWQPLAEKQIEDLIAVVQQARLDALACDDRSPRYVEPDLAKLVVRDGTFAAEGRPVFLMGFNGQPQDEDRMPLLKAMGVNVLGFACGPGWTATGVDTFDRRRLVPKLNDVCDLAAKHNCRVDVLFGHGIRGMKWIVEQHPDVLDGPGHFVDYDIDHPAMREVWTNFFAAFGPALAKRAEILSYDLSNEPSFPRFSKRTAAKFRASLRKQYGTIERLNDVWGMKLRSFDDCRPRTLPTVSRGAWYDWCLFNRVRVMDFYRHLNSGLRRYDRNALVHVKLAGEVMFTGSRNLRGRRLGRSRHDDGMDREWLDAICDIHGTDVRPVHKPFRSTFPAALDWQGQAMTFDFMKSIAPGKPIFDSEWHAVQTVYYESNDIPPEHMETALWLAHLRGMSANLIWWWSRMNGPEHKPQWFNGSLLVQPKLMAAYCRTMLELKRLAADVARFARGPRPVRFYFSRPSAIQDVESLDELWEAYGGANFLGRGLGFLTDKQIAAREFADCRVLVVANAKYASDAVLAGVRGFAAQGGAVVLIGPDNFAFDPWGRAREGRDVRGANVTRLKRAGARAHYAALLPIVARAAPLPDVAVLGGDGRPAWGVETRTIVAGGRALVYAVNVSPKPVEVELRAGGKPVRWLRGAAFTRLDPLRPVLAQVGR